MKKIFIQTFQWEKIDNSHWGVYQTIKSGIKHRVLLIKLFKCPLWDERPITIYLFKNAIKIDLPARSLDKAKQRAIEEYQKVLKQLAI